MSDRFHLPATVKTPEIIVDYDVGEMIMRGRSLPEDAIEFYMSTFEALEKASLSQSFFTLKFYIEYLNTSSSSVIRSIMELFQDKKNDGSLDFKVIWYYEEDDLEMEETGLHFQQTIPGLVVEFEEVDSI